MKWICDNNVLTDDNISVVETKLKVTFPSDFITIIKIVLYKKRKNKKTRNK